MLKIFIEKYIISSLFFPCSVTNFSYEEKKKKTLKKNVG